MSSSIGAARLHRRSAAALFVLCLTVLLSGIGISGAWAGGPASPTPVAASPAVENCPKVPGHVSCLSVHEAVPMATRHSGAVTRAVAALTAYGPQDLASAYRVPSSNSTATVAIVDAFDAPTVEADLAAYRMQFGLPACTSDNKCFQKVNQAGEAAPLPIADDGWAQETTLDVEMVSAICPTCHILLVEATDDLLSTPNLEIAVSTAVAMHARYVSMSWGTDETAAQRGLDRTYLSAAGVTYVAASGDADYGTSWPAASSNVVSVGGTTLERSGSARGWTESVWGYTDGTGTGSGCSTQEPKPAYQQQIPTALCARRAINDVSVVGDPDTGVAVYQGGSWWQYGGTSAGAPIIAAMYAIAGGATSTPPPSYPYAHRGSFNDITGNANGYCGNALCTAGRGWDGPSGIGSPIGIAGFAAIYSIVVHNPGTVTGYTGSPVSLNVRASDSGHLVVTFSATGLPTGATVRSDGLIVGAPKMAGRYVVTVTGHDARGSGSSTTFRWNVNNHTLVTTAVPHISGALRRSATVTADYGTFRQDSVRGPLVRPLVRFQWYVDGRAIAGAVHAQFKIPTNYLRHRISFHLSATATNFTAYVHQTPASALIG